MPQGVPSNKRSKPWTCHDANPLLRFFHNAGPRRGRCPSGGAAGRSVSAGNTDDSGVASGAATALANTAAHYRARRHLRFRASGQRASVRRRDVGRKPPPSTSNA